MNHDTRSETSLHHNQQVFRIAAPLSHQKHQKAGCACTKGMCVRCINAPQGVTLPNAGQTSHTIEPARPLAVANPSWLPAQRQLKSSTRATDACLLLYAASLLGARAAPSCLASHAQRSTRGTPLEQHVAVHVGARGAKLLEQQRLVGNSCQRRAIGCGPTSAPHQGQHMSAPATQHHAVDDCRQASVSHTSCQDGMLQ